MFCTCGRALRYVSSYGGGVPLFEFPIDTIVHLRTPRGISILTSKRGEFEFTGLAPGRYRVSVDTPAAYVSAATSAQVEIPNARALAYLQFSFADTGRIGGRLVDRAGTPSSGVRLELLTAAALPRVHEVSPQQSHTRPDGSFEFG